LEWENQEEPANPESLGKRPIKQSKGRRADGVVGSFGMGLES